MAKDCRQCGCKVEGLGGQAICYGCYLDSLLPRWYIAAEKYEYASDDPPGGQRTRHPKTGVPLLDDTPTRIRDIAALMKSRPPWV